MKIPSNSLWKQPNLSDLFGPLAATKCMILDEPGYATLAPRTVRLYSNDDDTDFDVPLYFGRYQPGTFFIVTSDAAFTLQFDPDTLAIAEEAGTLAPALTLGSAGLWWQNRWYVSLDTAIRYRTTTSDTFVSAVTGLTSGARHPLAILKTLNYLLVGNGNVVKAYDSSHSNVANLTLPSDFEVIGIAYNNGKAGIITRLGDDTDGQDDSAYFFTWDGATSAAQQGVAVGSIAAIGISPNKNTFLLHLKDGRVVYWNGGGLVDSGNFPFFNLSGMQITEGDNTLTTHGDSMRQLTSTRTLINATLVLSSFGKYQEEHSPRSPSGVYCHDTDVGLYHRYAPSISPMTLISVADGDQNASTDVLTATSGTVPATGSVALYAGTAGASIGGLKRNTAYYIINLTSTTFQLAASREDADEGRAIDITATSGNTAYFYMVEFHDFGQTLFDTAGGIGLCEAPTSVYRDILVGASLQDRTASAGATESMCIGVPFLENRGHLIFSRINALEIEDEAQSLVVKFRPLGAEDVIVVKEKPSDVAGLPVTTPQNIRSSSIGTWQGKRSLTSSADLSAAKDYLDADVNNQLELEVVSGSGGGVSVQISSIDYDSATEVYAIGVEEDVPGAAVEEVFDFSIDNWHLLRKITSADTDENEKGYAEVSCGTISKRQIFKIELRGYGTTIETSDYTGRNETELE